MSGPPVLSVGVSPDMTIWQEANRFAFAQIVRQASL
jgi:hypothetical protein